MITIHNKTFYTVTEAADNAGCTVSYIRQLLRAGKLKGEKVGDRAWLIPLTEVKNILKRKV
jgi:excisionase family DNA binding protein